MYLLNKRVGFFRKGMGQSESDKLNYFFIGVSGLMFYDGNWFKLRSLIGESKSLEEVEERMMKEEINILDLKRYQLSTPICVQQQEENMGFMNKQCFEMICEQGQPPCIRMFGLSDDTDILDLYNYVKTIDNQSPFASAFKQQIDSPRQAQKLIQHQMSSAEQAKKAHLEKDLTFFLFVQDQYAKKQQESEDNDKEYVYIYSLLQKQEEQNRQPTELLNQIHQISDQITYSGQILDSHPHGNGMEISTDGTQYKGSYRYGKRHGPGQFVDSNLDMYSYEYIMGRPVGI